MGLAVAGLTAYRDIFPAVIEDDVALNLRCTRDCTSLQAVNMCFNEFARVL